MKTVATVSSIAALLLAALFVCMPSSVLAAAADDAEIIFPSSSRITLEGLDAPRFDIQGKTGSSRGPNAEKWYMVEWMFDVSPIERKFIDEVTFKVFVEALEFRDAADREGTPIVLTGEVSYILLSAGKEQYGCMFLPPQVVAKFGGETFLKRSTTNVYVEAYINGQLVTETGRNPAHRDDPGAWKARLKAIPKFLYTKDHSPWISSGTYRYPLQKLDAPR
ncbi:MAG: hypothetical protein ACAI35_11335 [Candidatus Methylacidiphilales bacterium]|nr:hypothetical protein [Candidatus Methylacidiphilales bacterium]